MSDVSNTPFVVAVPSKGRLQENAAQFFARAGLTLVQGRGARDYRGTLAGFDGLEVAYLPVSEIVASLKDGSVHLGVAGEDLIREAMPDADARVELLAPLGFGNANVVVAVPQAWIDVRTMTDLEDVAAIFHARRGQRMRVATKYIDLTRRFFALHGVSDYRIVESLGATEGAPASGTAELIVDITTTGATLTANALKVLDDGVILRSEANLVASMRADWSEPHLRTARAILSRIAAEETARQTRDVVADFPDVRDGLGQEAAERFGATLLSEGKREATTFRCKRRDAASLAEWLIEQGAHAVSVRTNDYLFASDSPLFDTLVHRVRRT
ncbi:ATP phosphoribosyltransferase [Lichenihabitans psoromatis]|uniref:ATP phosphoribosyltransferase n=1 Tax=Lichenihabitans psoromatis TaxID=2528642 RepID=UPI0010385B23|nr:ATP phosphoribosyltransferase [Lichenihabitans psoromatis]